MTSAIDVRGVSVGSGAASSVRDLDLEVRPGEVVALLGANGAGKSTTVRAICGLSKVMSGAVAVLGHDITTASPRARARLGLAAVPEDRGLFTQLTVAENLRVAAPAGVRELDLDAWFPGLVPILRRRAGLLSGGEQAMLALARALVRRPAALVVDELSTGLAPKLAGEAMLLLRRAADEWGTGVLVAEQSAELALGAVDRACVLRRGEAVFDGAPAALRDRKDFLESTYLGGLD